MIGPTANKLPDTIPEMFDLFIARWAISGFPDISVADKFFQKFLLQTTWVTQITCNAPQY